MQKNPLTIKVIMNDKIFRGFAMFDSVVRKRLWKSPAIFTGILAFCGLICLVFRDRATHAGLLGSVLLIVGFGVPIIYFRAYSSSINMQVKNYKLAIPRHVYTLTLSQKDNGIEVSNTSGENAEYEWAKVHAIYRVKSCFYLYVAPNKAFLLPDAQTDTKALKELIQEKLPPEKVFYRYKDK